jgi:DNA-binding protein H-NS
VGNPRAVAPLCLARCVRTSISRRRVVRPTPVQRESPLQLSLDQIAAAKACGIAFTPASPDQIQRLSMQRKVFWIDGQPHLASRDGSFFETAATLERSIADRLEAQQERDLAAWEVSGDAVSHEAEAVASFQAAAEPELQEKQEEAKAALLAKWRAEAAESHLSLESILAGRKVRRGTGDKVAAKFRNLETGATWSGRGREPNWLKGKNREEFKI